MGTPSASAKAISDTLGLFDAQTSRWNLSNPHTIGNVRFVLSRTLRDGDESRLLGTVRHYFKDSVWRDGFEVWLLGLVRNTPGYPLGEELE